MLYARERRTRKIIAAAKASPYGDYRCPTCDAEVFLKQGRIYVTHFAHMPGQGKPECDDFHPTEDLHYHWQIPSNESPPAFVDPLQLSIELEPHTGSLRGPRKWGLRVTVPKSDDARGEISVDLGGGDVRKISLAALSLGARTYRADPASPDFGAIWASPEVRPEYRAAVEHRIAGLDDRTATVFAALPQKLKPQCNVVRWAESYYFIWRSEMPMPFPQSVLNHPLAENHGWSCSLVALPDKPEAEVAAWLGQTCALQIARAKREWSLVYPAPYAIDDDGTLQISSAARVFLAIKPIDEDGGAEVRFLSGQQSASLHLSGSCRHIVEITLDRQTQSQPVHLTWNETPLNSLVAKPYPDPEQEPAVVLEFGTPSSKTKVPFHRGSCRDLLAQAREGKAQLCGAHAYPGLRGQLRFRPLGQLEWETEQLVFQQTQQFPSTDSTSLPDAQIERINAVLRDRLLDVALDFGAFGGFSAHAAPPIRTHPRPLQIPRQLRNRIEWLCKASGAFADARHRPVSALDDASLIVHLSSVALPGWLLAHRRALERELGKAAGALPL